MFKLFATYHALGVLLGVFIYLGTNAFEEKALFDSNKIENTTLFKKNTALPDVTLNTIKVSESDVSKKANLLTTTPIVEIRKEIGQLNNDKNNTSIHEVKPRLDKNISVKATKPRVNVEQRLTNKETTATESIVEKSDLTPIPPILKGAKEIEPSINDKKNNTSNHDSKPDRHSKLNKVNTLKSIKVLVKPIQTVITKKIKPNNRKKKNIKKKPLKVKKKNRSKSPQSPTIEQALNINLTQ